MLVLHLAQVPNDPSRRFGRLIDFFSEPDRWWLWSERAIVILVAAIVTLVVLRVVRRLLGELQEKRAVPEAAMRPIVRFVRIAILALATLATLQILGVPMSTVWAGLTTILALIAIGFIAVWSVLSNVACSLLLLIFKPFRIGDTIEVVDSAAGPNIVGRVIDVTLMYVVLREELESGQIVQTRVPNNLFFQKSLRVRGGRHAIPIEAHVDKHGLAGREKEPPQD
jgi:small-conductance mechanosensitive channel